MLSASEGPWFCLTSVGRPIPTPVTSLPPLSEVSYPFGESRLTLEESSRVRDYSSHCSKGYLTHWLWMVA